MLRAPRTNVKHVRAQPPWRAFLKEGERGAPAAGQTQEAPGGKAWSRAPCVVADEDVGGNLC